MWGHKKSSPEHDINHNFVKKQIGIYMCKYLLPNNSIFQPFPKHQILHSSKRKEFADDNFNFGINGRKFSEWVKNTVGKGEIAHYKPFLLFPVFSSLVLQTCKNQGLFGKGLMTI